MKCYGHYKLVWIFVWIKYLTNTSRGQNLSSDNDDDTLSDAFHFSVAKYQFLSTSNRNKIDWPFYTTLQPTKQAND